MHGVLYSHKEEWSIDTGYNMGEPWNHYAKWRQSQKATYDMIPFIWNIQDGQILFLFLASRHGLQDLSSPTSYWSPGPSSESVASFSLHHHGILQEWSDSFFFFLTLQYCISFAKYGNESATGIHVFPILSPPPSSLPIPSLWVVPVHQPQASSIVHWTWTGDLFHTWYYTWFNAILPILPTLSLSHRVHKTDLYISVSFAVSYTGLLLPSF